METGSFEFDKLSRTPVIACGSNAAPEQLLRKFGSAHDPIFVSAAILKGFRCTYSAHITSYGSIPATLSRLPHQDTHCHITWLTDAQISKMHETEALGVNYRYSKLSNLKLHCSIQGSLNAAMAYISLHGSLLINNKPIGVAGINHSAVGTSLLTMTQKELQAAVLKLLGIDIPLDEFILENINNTPLRKKRTQSFINISNAFTYKHENVLLDTEPA